VILTTSVRHSLFSTNAILPDTQRAFPEQLWNVTAGLTYIHKFENGWTSGLMTTFGSASDKPFNSLDEMNVGLMGFLRIPTQNERDAWMLALFYSPVANLNFPIPGIAYSWNPSPDLRVNIGLPFSLMWRPIEDLTINLFYVPLTNINARVTYRVAENINLYAAYEFLNEAYFLADRLNRRDRFMAFEQRVVGGVRWDVWKHAALDVNAGYVFGRNYGEGRNQGSNLRDRVEIAPGAFLGGSLRIRF
jgi:hypothetical protein